MRVAGYINYHIWKITIRQESLLNWDINGAGCRVIDTKYTDVDFSVPMRGRYFISGRLSSWSCIVILNESYVIQTMQYRASRYTSTMRLLHN